MKTANLSHTYKMPGIGKKEKLFKKYNGRCYYCGKTLVSEFGVINMHIDHVVPKSKGGSGNINNCVPACPKCNISKGPKDIEEYRYFIAKKKRFNGDVWFSDKQIEWIEQNGLKLNIETELFYGEKI